MAHQADHRLEPLAVLLERAKERLREDPRDEGEEQPKHRADEHRATEPAADTNERGGDGREVHFDLRGGLGWP